MSPIHGLSLSAPDTLSTLPQWRKARQELPDHALPDVERATAEALATALPPDRSLDGASVAIAVGSRGITDLPTVVRTTVATLRQEGAEPFIVPAMGSHGGATPVGQRDVLAALGIDEVSTGAPIRSSMATACLGTVLGDFDVHVAADACAADFIVPINRIKLHTDFRAGVESGLHKMLAIGLGKQAGAAALHSYPLAKFGTIIRAAGRLIIDRLPVLFGVALIEDGHKSLAHIEAVLGEQIPEREPELLRTATRYLARIPTDELDVLIVSRVGKDISGAGMDPNVTGRFVVPEIIPMTRSERVVVLGLTPATHGNAAGIGMADVITADTFNRIDLQSTYINHMTTHSLVGAKMPVIAATERDAVLYAIESLPDRLGRDLRICMIRDTAHLEELWATEAVVASSGDLLRPTGPLTPITFDQDGRMTTPGIRF